MAEALFDGISLDNALPEMGSVDWKIAQHRDDQSVSFARIYIFPTTEQNQYPQSNEEKRFLFEN